MNKNTVVLAAAVAACGIFIGLKASTMTQVATFIEQSPPGFAAETPRNRLATLQADVTQEAGVSPEFVGIPYNATQEFDGLTKAQVLSLRSQAVLQHPLLIKNGAYVPDSAIFGQLEDGKPWWGLEGEYVTGPENNHGPDGASEESRFILNPFLLVAPDFYPPTALGRPGALPCEPTSLVWAPKLALAEVTYSSACVQKNTAQVFDLVAYNAKDLGLPYLAVNWERSTNLDQENRNDTPYENPQYLHRGPSCQYPGGCNNMSPRTPPIEHFRFTQPQGSMEVWLWQARPQNRHVTPDFRFRIKIE
ncbi:hypothetical protein [Burkholderia ubonensis]|uniref:hypothetical protein n=1 Tax=Burkholderia ubonensis TaxID=101571 RepID=UPI0012FC511A|nr:hypothetical protein [Burkholderia ubonensis]